MEFLIDSEYEKKCNDRQFEHNRTITKHHRLIFSATLGTFNAIHIVSTKKKLEKKPHRN